MVCNNPGCGKHLVKVDDHYEHVDGSSCSTFDVTTLGSDMIIESDSGIFKNMQIEVRECNEQNGWYDSDRRFGEDIALLHSEVSEALEAYREYGTKDATARVGQENPMPKPEGVGSELADVLVRLLDTCDRYEIDLFTEWRRKMDYNWQRSYRHGGKAL